MGDSPSLSRLTLSKHWGDSARGTVVEVDEARADWLRKNGYEAPSVLAISVEDVAEIAEVHRWLSPEPEEEHTNDADLTEEELYDEEESPDFYGDDLDGEPETLNDAENSEEDE